ncbi:MAG: tetratricopeptide repeat protein [Magnetovibrio sp.]|nr:tetratricopeptide repeat protein [Magnetovibrio sp.]
MSSIIINPHQPAPTPGHDAQPESLTPSGGGQDVVINGNTENFVTEVIESSQAGPVIVYFWTPDSKPATVMDGILQKLVHRAGGLLKMVRLNFNDNPALAQQLQVQTVPTVFVFSQGRPIDAFSGVQGEVQLQVFIDKILGDAVPPLEAAMSQAAERLKAGQAAEAEDIYTTILAEDADYLPALAGMIRSIAALNDFDRATDIIQSLDPKTRHAHDIEQAISALDLAQQCAKTDPAGISALVSTLATDPKNLEVRFELAQTLWAAQRIDEAIEHLLDIVRRDRGWQDAAGRKLLIKIFDTLGPHDPTTIEARKQLSAIFFS